MAAAFCTMLRTFLSVKVVALRRRVISFRRGCVQLPGLSIAGGGGAGRLGVEAMTFVEDMVVVILVMSPGLFVGGCIEVGAPGNGELKAQWCLRSRLGNWRGWDGRLGVGMLRIQSDGDKHTSVQVIPAVG